MNFTFFYGAIDTLVWVIDVAVVGKAVHVEDGCVKELSLVKTTEHTLLFVIEGSWLERADWVDLEIGQDVLKHLTNSVIA